MSCMAWQPTGKLFVFVHCIVYVCKTVEELWVEVGLNK